MGVVVLMVLPKLLLLAVGGVEAAGVNTSVLHIGHQC